MRGGNGAGSRFELEAYIRSIESFISLLCEF